MRNFDEWLSKFRASISGYDYYIDFNKVVRNVDEIKVELNILNSLIGSKDIENDFEKIVTRYPETLTCIPLLLAVRGNEIYAQDEEGAFLYNFKQMNYSAEQYKVFMRKTGLFDMIQNHLVNNLVDYALGVETGLDSNGRKNRGGHQMEDLVEKYIAAAGFVRDETYFKEMYISDIEKKGETHTIAATPAWPGYALPSHNPIYQYPPQYNYISNIATLYPQPTAPRRPIQAPQPFIQTQASNPSTYRPLNPYPYNIPNTSLNRNQNIAKVQTKGES